ncbi:hypothetical protein Tco_0850811 [Tanacetum coccineum]
MSTLIQQTLTDSGANERPPTLEKGNYIPWESRFRRFLNNKLEDGERIWNSIQNRPYKRPMIPNPDNDQQEILKPLLMFGSEVTSHVRHSRLMDEFHKFAAKEEESLESMYERFTTLVNTMDQNNVRPIPVSINTKFLNSLQPEWRKYVTMVHHNQTGDTVSYDVLYDSLVQFKPHVLASKAKKAAKNHDLLALIAHSNLQGDSQEDKLTTATMLLARAITQKFFIPINNCLRTSSNTINQAVIQDGRVDIQTKNAGYGGNGNRNAGRQNKNQAFNVGTGNDESNQIKGHKARDCQKPRVRDAKYFREQMLLANLNDEENDFMLDNSYGEETMEELTAAIMLIRIQPADGDAETVPSYDAKTVNKVNASSKVHE